MNLRLQPDDMAWHNMKCEPENRHVSAQQAAQPLNTELELELELDVHKARDSFYALMHLCWEVKYAMVR